jgi:hypothetical protein
LAKILHDLWIITNEGIVLFNHSFNPEIETQLFGALLSALNTFAEELSEGGLQNFELSNKQYIIMKKNKLIFIANSPKKVKKNKIINELESISEKFFDKYGTVLEKGNWDGDIDLFADFEEEIKEAFEDPVKKFWNGF